MKEMDDLFKSRLENHSMSPSPSAWEKVESGITGKKSYVVVWRWAAAVLVGAVLLGLFLRQPDNSETVATTHPVPEKKLSAKKPQDQSSSPLAQIKKNVVKQRRTTNQHLPVIEAEKQSNQVMQEQEVENAMPPSETVVTAQVSNPAPAESRKRIVLTYTLEDVAAPVAGPAYANASAGEAKQTEEKETIAASSAVVADQKETSFRKMFDFARTVKNSDSPIGNLRDMKEELFALELKKKSTSKKH